MGPGAKRRDDIVGGVTFLIRSRNSNRDIAYFRGSWTHALQYCGRSQSGIGIGGHVRRPYSTPADGLSFSAASSSAGPVLSAVTNQSAISPEVTKIVSDRLISISSAFSR